MKRKTIALDMDEVVADVMPKFLDAYEQEFGIRLKRSDYWGKKVYDIPGAEHIRGVLRDKGFFRDLPLMSHCKEVVETLTASYDVFFTTAAMEFRNSLEDKYDWLLEHFPFISWKNFVFCGDKSIIRADYMIDDHVRNLLKFQGKGLLFTASHNVDEQRFTRVDDWLALKAFFEQEQQRHG
ncbi:MAG: 5'(3')-deoxyribonucleotidase [Saprospiraceae bacterium]